LRKKERWHLNNKIEKNLMRKQSKERLLFLVVLEARASLEAQEYLAEGRSKGGQTRKEQLGTELRVSGDEHYGQVRRRAC
jgi:hypothetical protein